MLGTWFMWLTTAAVALLVPATAALFTIARSPHKAAPRGLDRHLRVAVAATAVGLGAMLVAALLDAGAGGSATVAVALAGVVLGNAPSRDGWAVRGVVVRGLAVAAVASGLLWLAYRAVSFGPSLTLLAVQAVLLAVSALAALRLVPVVDGWVHRRAALADAEGDEGDEGDEPSPVARRGGGALLRTGGAAAALGALVLPAAAVAVVTAVNTVEPPVAERAAAPAGTGTGVPSSAVSSGGRRTGAAGPSHAPPSGTPAEAGAVLTGSTPAEPATTSATADVEAQTGRAAVPSGDPSPTATPTDTDTSGDAGPSPSESPSEPGLPTLIPWPSPEPDETKTPGYAKEKPHRPSDAPSPGNGHG